MDNVKFRESQRKIIEEYDGGMMGISAVPGSGKTFTLSHLAARLVEKLAAEGTDDQEVLIVTFSNSAVNSFKKRIADILQQDRGLLPYVGYRVRTLHGLAHDIVRERPALVGLAEDFQIIDERMAAQILDEVVHTHLPAWEFLMDRYISTDLKESQIPRVRNHEFPKLFVNVAERYIKSAKDLLMSPEEMADGLQDRDEDFDLSRFANAVYADYQRALAYRGAVDFDDLMVLALGALQLDEQYLARLQNRWAYVLEDEAQDSSSVQERMLRLLADGRNWVRVGDPNQAIYTTFTAADSSYLIKFLSEDGVQKRDLPVSGRSGQPIIDMANELVRWTVEEHPVEELRDSFYPQNIMPTEPDDPQQNPLAEETRIHIHYKPGQKVTPEQELEIVVKSLRRFLKESPDRTVALLVPENSRGFKLAQALKDAGLPYEELLRSTTGARTAAAFLAAVLEYAASPYDSGLLARMYQDVWVVLFPTDLAEAEEIHKYLAGLRFVESVVWDADSSLIELHSLSEFLAFVRMVLAGLSLPVDQLVLTVSQRLFSDAVDVALAYKVSSLLRSFAALNAGWRLGDFVRELRAVVDNQRRFLGFDDVSEGYVPVAGLPTIATFHASKGLEWDRVYLMAVSNYGFPSVQPFDDYVGERWFNASGLNLSEEIISQAYNISNRAVYSFGESSRLGRFSYSSERLRLLYVGFTRCRGDLVVTWNVGRFSGRVSNVLSLSVGSLLGFLGNGV